MSLFSIFFELSNSESWESVPSFTPKRDKIYKNKYFQTGKDIGVMSVDLKYFIINFISFLTLITAFCQITCYLW